MNKPLVSIIIPTFNSERTLGACLNSIKEQTYSPIEIIIVDKQSKDKTAVIAKEYTNQIYFYGTERSEQRNYGAKKAHGDYLCFIDSDMELSKNVVKSCVEKSHNDTNVKGIIIPEESFGEGFWAKCKKLEKSFYIGNDAIEAARFFDRDAFGKVGGYDEGLVSGEDWDLSQRIAKTGSLKRINDFIYHNEGEIDLIKSVKKKYYYAQKFSGYLNKDKNENLDKQTGLINRYKIFLSKPQKLLSDPITASGMLFMKTLEFGFGGLGYILKNKTAYVS